MSSAESLNDPFDCSFALNIEEAEKKSGNNNYDPVAAKKLQLFCDRAATSMRRGAYVFSLSKTKDSILMWRHYVNNHTGICVEYLLADLLDVCKKEKMYILPVIYVEKREFIMGTNQYGQAMLKKAKCWEYENEWRIIKYDQSLKDDHYEIIDCAKPTSIILGADIWKIKNESYNEGNLSDVYIQNFARLK
ncbi:MAG: DUF2971 domain-containing protein [Lachnospiraceae bacterium]|nr:DUF2971 domain-containing protein [Lachnospiraceae bacterium]